MCSTGVIAGIDVLASQDVYTTPAAALAEEVVELHRELARLQGQITRRVAALDHLTTGKIDGHVSTASWVRDTCSTTHEYASDLVRTSRVLDSRPACAKVLTAGAMSYPHARVITAALTDLPAESRDCAEHILLDAAVKLDPGQVAVGGHPAAGDHQP